MAEQIVHDEVTTYKNRNAWLRGFFMLLCVFFYHIAIMLVGAVAIIQFVWVLATGRDNPRLTEFGAALARYFQQLVRFLTYNTETKPFPFSDWPDKGTPDDVINL